MAAWGGAADSGALSIWWGATSNDTFFLGEVVHDLAMGRFETIREDATGSSQCT
jgi:hypothetical protein